ncbi:unnamed protein product [Dicrocoelium dendriticum]|nr:unnamed protein product [Dicrocoelium dendriticum]
MLSNLQVQDLLAQLTKLFSDQLLHGHSAKDNGSLPTHQPQKVEAIEDKLENHHSPATTPGAAWDQRGRELLHALSESVATASARNKEATLPRPTTAEQAQTSTVILDGQHQCSEGMEQTLVKWTSTNPEWMRNPVEVRVTNKQQMYKSVATPTPNGIHFPTEEDHLDPPEVTVCHLPPLCWSSDQVLYWLTEYACLPGGCLEEAKRMRLDGRQLTTLPSGKLDKMLCLNDPGLQRKLQLALEDLRVHGSPGISHCPGPSHIRPHWVCEVWLRRYLGLAQLAPSFAVRRVDGRMLASLAIYKASKRTGSSLTGAQIELKYQDANPVPPTGVLHLANTPNGTEHELSTPMKNDSGIWRGASRKELCRILLGISRDNSGNGANVSGAELPQTAKLLLGKREAYSLRTGIELLRRFDFNIEMLENAQRQCEDVDDNLLLWTNERVAKWLRGLGLQEFTQGIEGTGLHGAYMVLDPQFDTNRLMKYIHLPANVASLYQLDSHLQALLKSARLREGNLCTKQ